MKFLERGFEDHLGSHYPYSGVGCVGGLFEAPRGGHECGISFKDGYLPSIYVKVTDAEYDELIRRVFGEEK